MSARVRASRSGPGERLYAEHTGRFVRLVEDQPEKAFTEYGFTFLHSVDESDAAIFRKRVGLSDGSWRDSFLEAVAAHRRGKLDEAEKRYKELRDKDKGATRGGEVDYNLAALYLQRGDFDAAKKHLDNFEKRLGEVDQSRQTEYRSRIAEMRAELRSA